MVQQFSTSFGLVKTPVGFPMSPSYPGQSPHPVIFSLWCLLNDRRRTTDWPHLFLLNVHWKCDLKEYLSPMLHLFKWVHQRCLILFSSTLNSLHSSHLWSCLSCCVSASLEGLQPSNTVGSPLVSPHAAPHTTLTYKHSILIPLTL